MTTAHKNITILEPWSDCIGLLHSISEQDGRRLAAIGPLVVSLPSELVEQLRPLIGQRVGVLRTDSEYRVRARDPL